MMLPSEEHSDVMVCEPAEELPPDSAHATTDGTKRFLAAGRRLNGSCLLLFSLTCRNGSPTIMSESEARKKLVTCPARNDFLQWIGQPHRCLC